MKRYVTNSAGELVPEREFTAAKLANARLKAAAPDLLEALRGLVASIESAAAAGIDTTGHIGVGKALAAIRKAEGK